MEELADKIKAMLSDPEGVERIMGIAKVLGEKGALAPKEEKTQSEASEPKESLVPASARPSTEDNPLASILNNPELKRLFGKDCKKRNELLRALCPFLSEEKREKLERIIKATSTIEMVYSAGSFLT